MDDSPSQNTNTYLTTEQEQEYLANNSEFEQYAKFMDLFSHMDNVLSNRGNDYAHPLDNFTRIAEGLNWRFKGRFVPGGEFTAEDIPDVNVITKMARTTNKLKLDNPVDLIGYAACQIILIAERIRRIKAKRSAGSK